MDVFKGFKQIKGSDASGQGFSFEDGYLYLVRKDEKGDANDGYVYFNGKKYGTAHDKQDLLTVGSGVTIENNVISAKISNTLSSTAINESLSAKQGKVLNDKINASIPLVIGLDFSKTLPLRYGGTTVSGDITWMVTKNGESVTPDSLSLKIDGTEVFSGTGSSSYTYGFNKQGFTIVSLTVSKDGSTDTKEMPIQMVVDAYFGFAGSSITSSDFSTFDNVGLLKNATGIYSLTNDSDGKYLWICVDEKQIVGSVKGSSIEIPMEAPLTNIQNYKCYRSSNSFRMSDIEITLEESEFPISSELAFSKSLPLEYTGTAVSGNVIWSVYEDGMAVTPDTVSLKVGNTVVSTNTGQTVYSASFNNHGTTKVTVNAAKNGENTLSTLNVPMVVKAYFGFAGSGITSSDFTSLVNEGLLATPIGKYTLTNSTSGKYLWLCVDKNQVISNVRSYGFTVPMEQAITTVPNYKCYRSSNSISAVTMNITID